MPTLEINATQPWLIAQLGYDIVAKKFRRSPAGETKGWGLKVFP